MANSLLVDKFQDLNFMLHIESYLRLWPLIKNDVCYQTYEIMPIYHFQFHFLDKQDRRYNSDPKARYG